MANALSFTLLFPIKSAAGETLTTLPIKRLKRRELGEAQRHARGDEAAMEDHLVAKMLGITLEDLGEFDIADSRRVTELFRELVGGGDLTAFLGRSAVTGAEDAAVGDKSAAHG
ncbi:phage tail assembly protein [Pseudomonas sp. microsymbiont 2]